MLEGRTPGVGQERRGEGVRRSRVAGLPSSALTTDTATTSNPKMAADAPALAMKKFA
jgi:hypothetical protein